MSKSLPLKSGRIVGYMGVAWIQGDGWHTGPPLMGPLKVWKLRRYAKRHGIVLEGPRA